MILQQRGGRPRPWVSTVVTGLNNLVAWCFGPVVPTTKRAIGISSVRVVETFRIAAPKVLDSV